MLKQLKGNGGLQNKSLVQGVPARFHDTNNTPSPLEVLLHISPTHTMIACHHRWHQVPSVCGTLQEVDNIVDHVVNKTHRQAAEQRL